MRSDAFPAFDHGSLADMRNLFLIADIFGTDGRLFPIAESLA